ncbi:MAG: hypothetical protein DRP74_08785 [Candidatus Omnitrophota bacterium]|nr:MAG: hypothetical protein DRP74_08785 [Candidatus Omnitrophota bacterium]
MISEKTIKELAHKYQTTEINVIREYCQHLFLSYFYQKKKSEHILFKGGTALRVIYESPRFSEDLDFTAVNIKIPEIEEIFIDSILDIEKTGIEVELEESKITSGGYLGIVFFRFLDFKGIIQLEVSLRNKGKVNSEINLINSDYVPPFNVISLSQERLAKEKVRALLERAKPRDFFDIYFILRSHLSIKKSGLELYKISKKLEETKIDFKRELGLLLPRSHHIILKNFKDVLKRELNKYA